jgi:riboflavin synthase
VFTGIVEDIGRLIALRRVTDGLRLKLGCGLDLSAVAVGDSIAVDGVCLTVTGKDRGWFEADVGHETLAATTLGRLQPGARVHLERALAFGDRLGGHLVTGHVDGLGELVERQARGAGLDLVLWAPAAVQPYLVPKGSVAVDGVSLTVNQPAADRFRVSLVPHTLTGTRLGERAVGERLNLEGDILGKYVRHFASGLAEQGGSRVDAAFLAEHGFGGRGGPDGGGS